VTITSDALLTAFAGIALALFVIELTDKDALLLLTLATRTRALRVFLAGATAFVLTTSIIVTVGTLAIRIIPILWIKFAGGAVMLAFGLWETKALVGERAIREQGERLEKSRSGLRAFLMMVGALALLDLAGDATEVLTIVFVAQYSDSLLVFSAVCVGLVAATAVETTLGNRLGRILTPRKIRLLSIAVFLSLGSFILVTSLGR
jgi:putative Ca2+/H+ antiporter (TMEM165/GDT1 family)